MSKYQKKYDKIAIKIEACRNKLYKLEEKRDILREKIRNDLPAYRCDNCGKMATYNNPHLLHYAGEDHYHCP